jgi:hypothetical protein
MTLVNFTNLDFDDIKKSIKDYIRSNSNFTDYDFEGSNLSTIIDILAYNTYISSYNANMMSNEVFIDSATLRENVVSLARNIGYVPQSKRSAVADVSFFVDVSNVETIPPLTLTLQKGIVCTTSQSFGGQSFIFSIPENISVPVVNGVGFFDDLKIYEGTFVTETFAVDPENLSSKYILNNSNIDTNSIRVFVSDSQNTNIKVKYNISEDIIDITPESKVFFIQEVEDQRYELIFGDGVFGKKLESGNIIEVSYIITNGENGNKISNFTYSGRILDNNGNLVTSEISIITTNSESSNGKEIESINSIKKYAPRIYSSQNRAVTAKDYESIIPKIYPQTESVTVFGGEELDPPKYGKVFITIKPIDGNFISSSVKQNIKNKLRKYAVSGIVPEIVDLKYLYIEVFSNVYFNPNLASNASSVKDIIVGNVQSYSNSSELNNYGARFKYSRFLNIIDNSNSSITSNITSIQMRRDLRPTSLNTFAEYEICFGNSFHIKNINGYNIKSSGFRIDGVNDNVYVGDLPLKDKKTGSLFLFRLNSEKEPIIVKKSIGTIDYTKGEIILKPIKIASTMKLKNGFPIIEFSASPKSNDVIGKQDLYLQLNINDVQINMIEDSIESGSDISGSLYSLSSSYLNGELVRK